MPQTGNLFDQPEAPSGGNKKASGKGLPAGRKAMPGAYRYAKKGSAKILSQNYEWLKGQADRVGRGYIEGRPSRGVPKPVQGRPSGAQIIGRRETFFGTTERAKRNRAGFDAKQAARAAGTSTPTPTQARPTPLNPNGRPTPLNPRYTPTQARPTPLNPYAYPTPLDPNADPRLGRESVLRPDGTRTRYIATGDERMSFAEQRVANGEAPKARIPGARSRPVGNQSAGPASTPQPPSGGTQKSGTRYAPAGTAKATGKGTRGVPRPSPRSNFKPATGSKPTGGMPAQLSQMPPGGAGPTAPGRTNVAGAINQSKMPAQFRQMPPSGAGPTAPGRTNIPGIPKGGGVGGFFKGVGRVLSNPMVAVASAIDMADKATNFRRIPYTGNFGGPSFAKNPYASTSGNPDAKPAGKKETTAPAATAAAPAQSGGNKPAGGQKPYEPRYFPEAGGNGNAVRKPDSYLGEAFDYSLQKGTTSGSKYLEHMFRRDKVSEDDQQRLRERFNKKVVGDQTLQEYGADKGITQTLEGKKSGLGEALLGKYRDTGTYKGNTDYDVMRAAAEARMARK